MNTKTVALVVVAAGLIAASLFMATAQAQTKPAGSDPRIDKLIEQNEKILKNQEDIQKQLADIKEGILQLRRRSS